MACGAPAFWRRRCWSVAPRATGRSREAIGRLANLPADEGWAIREITLLRLRALLARPAATTLPTATSSSLPRHGGLAWFSRAMKWAEAMP